MRKLFFQSCIVLILFLIAGCKNTPHSMDIYSFQFDNKADIMATLKQYLTKESGLVNAEYHIWIKDNETGSVPGPSDYTIKLALKINPDSLDSWIRDLEPSSKKISLHLWDELKLDSILWKVTSEPELYHSSLYNKVKVLYRKDNIIFGIYSTMPIAQDYLED